MTVAFPNGVSISPFRLCGMRMRTRPHATTNHVARDGRSLRYVRSTRPARRDLARDGRQPVRLPYSVLLPVFAVTCSTSAERLRYLMPNGWARLSGRCAGFARGLTAQTKIILRGLLALHHARRFRLSQSTGLGTALRIGFYDHFLRNRQHAVQTRVPTNSRPCHGIIRWPLSGDTVRQPPRRFLPE